jgi:glycosyltransferase involved in cell wall biosynthesis
MKPGKSICIISFSPIARDARVLRQIKYLSPHYRLTVIGYGPPHPAYADNPDITWIELDKKPPASPPRLITAWRTRDYANLKIAERIRNKARALITGASWYIGFVLPRAYELSYRFRRGWIHDAALARALESPCDAYHANDWKALPVAAEAARSTNARLVLDLHEYAPGQYEGRRFRMFDARMISYIIQKHATRVDASTTVAPLIAERYRERFHLDPLVVLSAPEWTELPRRALDPDNIRIVHHGVASRRRNPEAMIETIARCDRRYSLHFMLMENEYVKELRRRAEVMAPGRVTFHRPVPPQDIVSYLARFDIGIFVVPPVTYNLHAVLPNKFFEFINAGLAVCIGPSPSMAELVHAHGMGIVGPTFSPGDMADAINRTTPAQWQLMRDRARTASQNLNAQTEMAKVVRIYQDLL